MSDICIALINDLPFDVFGYTKTGFTASSDAAIDLPKLKDQVAEHLKNFEYTLSVQTVKPENWNAVWESNFHPILIDCFCGIRANFHPSFGDKVQHELIITPKMAFGSGHHETTRMVIRLMQHLDFQGTNVFDFGCGTGVLAILASRLGGKTIEAVDIELASYENSVENCAVNKVDNVAVKKGGISVAEQGPFDIILANINRNIILDSLLKIRQLSKKSSYLLCSGFLENDVPKVKKEAAKYGFTVVRMEQEADWCALCFQLK